MSGALGPVVASGVQGASPHPAVAHDTLVVVVLTAAFALACVLVALHLRRRPLSANVV